jgi:signal transduction histidine kinase
VILLGQSLVAYEVFTGKTLPRRGLLRFWRNAMALSAGYAIVAAASLTLQLRPVYIVLLSLALLAVSYALFSWRAYADRERQMVQLRPFVASQQLYEHLREQVGADDRRPTTDDRQTNEQLNHRAGYELRGRDSAITESFQALCRDVLNTRLGYLIPLGAAAALAGSPLTYADPEMEAQVEGGWPKLHGLNELIEAREPMVIPIEPAEAAGAILLLPLWAERKAGADRNQRAGLIGMMLLGEKSDGGLYAQEEIEIARAAGERLIDTLASAELARRLLLLQRQRLAESHVADQRTRRVLHDEVLPQLHAALLQLHAEAPASEAVNLLAAAHRQLADLLRELPATATPDVARLGLVDALRRLLAGELAGAFDSVEWRLNPGGEARATALPPLTADVCYWAAREALRNAARYARRPGAPLHVTLALTPASVNGLELSLEDNGAGLATNGASKGESTGQGLALHGTLLAVVGGTLTVESEAGLYTRVRLILP